MVDEAKKVSVELTLEEIELILDGLTMWRAEFDTGGDWADVEKMVDKLRRLQSLLEGK